MKTALVIMAAGMGSRFGGGIKQLEPVGPNGEIIMDYSIHDAIETGFNKVVFIIRKDIKEAFHDAIGKRIEGICNRLNVEFAYAYQELDDLPEGIKKPVDRSKPWGTGQAVLVCKDIIKEPFVVINADDYYGTSSFKVLYNYLMEHEDDKQYSYAMAGYILENTLTENGTVSRGVCETDEQGRLVKITERTMIKKGENGPAYSEDGGDTWTDLAADTPVSMNMWAFTGSIMKELKDRFPAFLEKGLQENSLKCEYFLPSVVSELMAEGKANVQVLKSNAKWYGVTYLEDKPMVVEAIAKLKAEGVYPQKLWEE